jgi:hypothetical protein
MASGGVSPLYFSNTFWIISIWNCRCIDMALSFLYKHMSWKLSNLTNGVRSFVSMSSAFFVFYCMSQDTNEIDELLPLYHCNQCTLQAFVWIQLSCYAQFLFHLTAEHAYISLVLLLESHDLMCTRNCDVSFLQCIVHCIFWKSFPGTPSLPG